jgi:hypothetical protein
MTAHLLEQFIENNEGLDTMVHACNPSHLGGRDRIAVQDQPRPKVRESLTSQVA